MYDWANSTFLTTIVTAVFPIYFAEVAAKPLGREKATSVFLAATTAGMVVSAVISPYLGALADCTGRTGEFDCSAMDWFLDRARALGVEHRPPAPILLGRHVLALGVPAGPRVGVILKAVYELQLDGTVRTLEDAVTAARERLG